VSSFRRRIVGWFTEARGLLPASVNDRVFALPVKAIDDTPELCAARGWSLVDLGARVERMPEVLACTDARLLARLRAEVVGLGRERRMFAAVVPDGRVHSHACTAIARQGIVLADVSPHARVPLHLHRALSGAVVARQPRRLAGRSALVGGIGHRNFYHWLYDSLPRIGLVRDAGLDAVDRWIVPATELAVARELLARAGIAAEKLEPIGRGDHVVCDELVVTSAPGEVCEPTPRTVDFLRATLPADRSRIAGKRVYIARRGRRRIANEGALADLLRRFGFTTVAMEDLSLDAQIASVAGAETILAPHGAALSHLMHAGDGATLIECMPPGYCNASFFVLAGACGLRYAALAGEGGADRGAANAAAASSRDFVVDESKLEQTLAAALA
jgi:hypothetical protein